jgi:hypothetical protein
VTSDWRRVAPTAKRAAVITPTGRWPRIQRLAINAFLIVHIVAITCWAIPLENPMTALCRNAVRPYFLWAGLFQSWDMFSPSPKSINLYVDAIVLYDDGNTRNWVFPRMDLLNLRDRYVQERYRKFVENLNGNVALWPDAARFIARMNNNRPIPVNMVFLVRHWSNIVFSPDGSYAPTPWDERIFYAYRPSAWELQ